MTLKDCIAHDIETIFLNTNDFCDNLTLQIGTTRLNVIGSLQANNIENNAGNSSPLQAVSYTLYIKYPLILDDNNTARLLSAGTRNTINDKSFTITGIADEMGLATITLDSRTGR